MIKIMIKTRLILGMVLWLMLLPAGACYANRMDLAARQGHYVSNDCGPQALHGLLRTFNINAPVSKIRTLAGTDKKGTTMLGLQKAAQVYGLKATGMRLTYRQLRSYVQRGYGVIAFINGDHYVWIKKIHPLGIVYVDGLSGPHFAGQRQWNKMWLAKKKTGDLKHNQGEGVCLILKPESGKKK